MIFGQVAAEPRPSLGGRSPLATAGVSPHLGATSDLTIRLQAALTDRYHLEGAHDVTPYGERFRPMRRVATPASASTNQVFVVDNGLEELRGKMKSH